MPRPTDDAAFSIQRLAATPPPRSAAGLFLRYDPSLQIYILVDKNAEDPEQRVVELYGLASTVIRLREIYGLSESQAREAVGRAFHGFGDEINLAWVMRTAMTQPLGLPEDLPRFVTNIPDGMLRAYAHELQAYFVGAKPMPATPAGIDPVQVQDLYQIFQSFGLKDPATADTVNPHQVLANALDQFAPTLPPVTDGEAIVRLAEGALEAAQATANLLRQEVPGLGEAVRLLGEDSRVRLHRELHGLRRLLAAISARVREGLGQ